MINPEDFPAHFNGIIFDLDKTAVEDGAVELDSWELPEAIAKLPEGFFIATATGRVSDYALPLIRQLNLPGESVVANGATIIDSNTGEVRWKRWIPEEYIRDLVGWLEGYEYLFFMDGDGMGSETMLADAEPRETASAFVRGMPRGAVKEVKSKVEDLGGFKMSVHESWLGEDLYDLQLGHADVTKALGVEVLINRYDALGNDLDPLDVVTVGDGRNDVSMFRLVGAGIAVANADPLLIRESDEVVGSQKDGGLVEVIRRFHA